jgi:hypothetical protein
VAGDLLRAAGGASALGAVTAVGGAVAATALQSGDDGDDDLPPDQPDRGEPRAYGDYTVHRIPEAYDTIQAAVNVADPEDLVLVFLTIAAHPALLGYRIATGPFISRLQARLIGD